MLNKEAGCKFNYFFMVLYSLKTPNKRLFVTVIISKKIRANFKRMPDLF